jgi:hypothetical protein
MKLANYEKVWKNIWKANLNIILEKSLRGNTEDIRKNQLDLHECLEKGVKEKYITHNKAVKIWWNSASQTAE